MKSDTVWHTRGALLFVGISLLAGAQEAQAQFTLRATAQTLTLEDLLRAGPPDLNGFWRNEFLQKNWRYDPPTHLYSYEGVVDTPCGPTIPENAFYCPANHSIYYHQSFIKETIFDSGKYGDFGTLTVLAHEWAHAVQAQLNTELMSSISVNRELQADCFAGAYARYLEAGQSTSLTLEEGDLEEGMSLLYDHGDNLQWFDPQAHGSPHERKLNFHIGLKEGVAACFRNIVYRDPHEIYRIAHPQSWLIRHQERWIEDIYHITFLMGPRHAEHTDINGYLSEGIRITMRLPQKGHVWSEAYQTAWTSGRMKQLLETNPGFFIVDSTAQSFDEFKGMRYRTLGNDARISEPEQTAILIAADPRLVIQVELVSPASRYTYYQDRLDALLNAFWVLSPIAPERRP